MFSRFDTWRYSSHSNCWDFVRAFLLEHTSIPESDLPRFGIAPDNKRAMTRASREVKKGFVECSPRNFAIACHYVGRTLIHVGVVDGEYVRHTNEHGTKKTKINEFEAMSQRTIYRIHHGIA